MRGVLQRSIFGVVGRQVRAVAMVIALSCTATVAVAQPSAEDKAAAAEAYDRGTAKLLKKDYAEAAQLFETAHRLAPASAALVQAVRSHDRAGNQRRAASLALQLESLYPDDALSKKTARAVLEETETKLARVDVKCGKCSLEVDGKIVDHPSFFIEPGTAVSVKASFETGPVEREVRGTAGETVEVAFEAPPRKEESVEPVPVAPRKPVRDGPPPRRDEELEPAVSWVVPAVLGGLTVVAGGALAWSGLDTLDKRDAYEAEPTRERFDDGRDLELRTNVLIGATAVLGAGAITTTFLAMSKSDPERDSASLDATLSVGPGAAAAAVRGTF